MPINEGIDRVPTIPLDGGVIPIGCTIDLIEVGLLWWLSNEEASTGKSHLH